ncbi:cobalt transporter CbiM [Clostridium sp. YIM B02515]|uniref:Cobalt transporter CbiM n=1 Tax=Clostridium rhizosphaerae TaxID=2803861 RepID=A0ABS1TFD1_9CLOT|nr:cobalt transporter CbiM [Clostridium rhizosphaerae]MBL4938084.1 cobalt transporter CbiM [Clostridium rhizosphaerae]
MHIPDNFLSPSTCAVLGAAMIPAWKKSIIKVNKNFKKKKLPLLGVCAAFSFLIMMFNIPLPGGTTGHAVGAVLAAILIGPYAASISITTALLIQALFFGDGGILAFGANCFNMAFIMPFSGYLIYKYVSDRFNSKKGKLAAVFAASYIGVNLAALAAAIEFGIQPLLFKDSAGLPLYCPYGLKVSIPAMMIPHLLVVGVLEGIITLGIYSYIKKVSPDSIYEGEKIKLKPIYNLIIGLVLLSPIGLLASGTAWGEWGTDEIKDILGFIPKGMQNGFNFNAIMPDYNLRGVNEILGYVVSAAAGILIIFLLLKLVKKMSRN